MGIEEWIKELERIFIYLDCTDAQRVFCAVFQLVEEASYWWESHSRTMTPEELQNLAWGKFKEMILEHYCPQSYRDHKEVAFLNLKQGTISVAKYERKFNQLFRYVFYLVDTERKKARRFEPFTLSWDCWNFGRFRVTHLC